MELKPNVTHRLNFLDLLIIYLSIFTLVLPNQLLHVPLPVYVLSSHKLDLPEVHFKLLAIRILDSNLDIIEHDLLLPILSQLRVECRLTHLPHQSQGILMAPLGGAHDFEELLVNRPEVKDKGVRRGDLLQLLQVLRFNQVVENVWRVLHELFELVL